MKESQSIIPSESSKPQNICVYIYLPIYSMIQFIWSLKAEKNLVIKWIIKWYNNIFYFVI